MEAQAVDVSPSRGSSFDLLRAQGLEKSNAAWTVA
jgi:hypothetical protein